MGSNLFLSHGKSALSHVTSLTFPPHTLPYSPHPILSSQHNPPAHLLHPVSLSRQHIHHQICNSDPSTPPQLIKPRGPPSEDKTPRQASVRDSSYPLKRT
ncbi:hypothetical protein E2C01_054426 [Portunus trituberculatus]|uniref:Uncharacterized protein n=1 Tax=Portunus trituberculatus TaxID=210409 RepID=A0A5B7GNM9_PORTR|nr:hypothetical protein [Portunus trituberculatus]